jgi:hypothetical protein
LSLFLTEARDTPSDGLLVMHLVTGFGVPNPAAMSAIGRRGFDLPDRFDDDELESSWTAGVPASRRE